MAGNEVYKNGHLLSLVCSDPATPLSGDPVRIGEMTGVAQTDERADGTTSVDVGPTVWNLSVAAINAGGNSAVVVGDKLYYVDANTPKLSKVATGRYFGYALQAINAGVTATIMVKHVDA